MNWSISHRLVARRAGAARHPPGGSAAGRACSEVSRAIFQAILQPQLKPCLSSIQLMRLFNRINKLPSAQQDALAMPLGKSRWFRTNALPDGLRRRLPDPIASVISSGANVREFLHNLVATCLGFPSAFFYVVDFIASEETGSDAHVDLEATIRSLEEATRSHPPLSVAHEDLEEVCELIYDLVPGNGRRTPDSLWETYRKCLPRECRECEFWPRGTSLYSLVWHLQWCAPGADEEYPLVRFVRHIAEQRAASASKLREWLMRIPGVDLQDWQPFERELPSSRDEHAQLIARALLAGFADVSGEDKQSPIPQGTVEAYRELERIVRSHLHLRPEEPSPWELLGDPFALVRSVSNALLQRGRPTADMITAAQELLSFIYPDEASKGTYDVSLDGRPLHAPRPLSEGARMRQVQASVDELAQWRHFYQEGQQVTASVRDLCVLLLLQGTSTPASYLRLHWVERTSNRLQHYLDDVVQAAQDDRPDSSGAKGLAVKCAAAKGRLDRLVQARVRDESGNGSITELKREVDELYNWCESLVQAIDSNLGREILNAQDQLRPPPFPS